MKNSLLYRAASFPFLPILITVIMPLSLVQANQDLFTGEASLMRVVAFCGLVALLLTFALVAFFRDVHRAGVLATVLVAILIFGSAHAKMGAQFIEAETGLPVPPSAMLMAAFAVASALLVKLRIPPFVTHAGNAATAALLAYNASLLWLTAPAVPEQGRGIATVAFSDARASRHSPDIIHVMLDGYSRADVLSETYGFDNTDFLTNLERMGFAIADNAVAPYNQTLLTMNGIFSGDYLSPSPESPAVSPSVYRNQLASDFRNNPTMTALSRMGYKTTATRSEYPPLSLEATPMAARNQGFSMTFIEQTLFEFSGFSLIVNDLGLSEALSNDSASTIRNALQTALDGRGNEPYFQFVHLLAPHPPFDVDSEGRPISSAGIFNKMADGSHLHANDPEKKKAYRHGYVQKLNFINSEILAFVETVIAERQRPLLILIHGDHGGGMHLDQDDASNSCLRERYLPLVAVYSSDGNLQKAVPENINLINLYRIIFDNYFATSLGLLPGKSEFASGGNPADRIPVTDASLDKVCAALD